MPGSGIRLAQVRFTAAQIAERVGELAADIRRDLGKEPPVLVAVLKGSLIFIADLCRRLEAETDVDFMMVSEFEGSASRTGVVRIIKDLDMSIQDRQVVVVETIVDTGLTLSFLLRTLMTRGPRSIRVCALLDKPMRRIAQPAIDYTGFEIHEYVVGYGLDFKGRYRNLPYILGVKDVPALAAQPDALEELYRGKAEQSP